MTVRNTFHSTFRMAKVWPLTVIFTNVPQI